MRRGVTILVGLLAVVTAAGFLDRVSWVFEPATVFRLQYVVLLLAAALLALALRQRHLVVAAVALAGVNIAGSPLGSMVPALLRRRRTRRCASLRSTSSRATTVTTSLRR
jgi:hypothetical protein